jgi:hypothetical protein
VYNSRQRQIAPPKKSIQGLAVLTLPQAHCPRRQLDRDSTGPCISKMQSKLLRHVKHARAHPHTNQSLRLQYNSSHALDHYKDGAWILSDPCHLCMGNKFTVVAIEYFTRWIEAKPLAKITSEIVKSSFGKT